MRGKTLLTLGAIILLSIAAYFWMKSASAQGAACVRHGVSAVCRSSVIEKQAKAKVLRRCPRCLLSDVSDWIYSLQMNRGPYASAEDLARDVLQQVRQ